MSRIASRAPSLVLTGLLIGSVLCLVGWQLYLGLCENEVFHIAGLYPNLRSQTLWPDVARWNFRPIGYKTVIALLSVGPINWLGWTDRFASMFIVLSSIVVVLPLFLIANGRRLTDKKAALRLALIAALVLGQPGNHPWSADAFSGYLALAGLLMVHRDFAFVKLSPFVFALAIGTGLYLFKGVSVVLALPMFCLMGERLGWGRSIRSYIFASATSLLLVSVASPETTRLLVESAVLQKSRFFPHPLGALHLFTRHLSPLFIIGIAVILIRDASRRYRRGWKHLLVPASTVTSALLFHGMQGKSWSYHLAPAYSFAAFLILERIDLLDSAHDVSKWSLALVASLVLGLPLSREHPIKYRIQLQDIAGLTHETEVLYLAYGGRGYARFGYPAACQMMSPHLIQRVKRTQATSDTRLSRSAELLRCANKYAGPIIVYQPKWMKLDAHGYHELLHKIKLGFQRVPTQGLPRGVRLLESKLHTP